MFHKVYITSGLNFRIVTKIYFVLLTLVYTSIYSQQMFNPYGFVENPKNGDYRMNSLESNRSNFSNIKDWEFSISLKNRLNKNNNLNLISFAVGKKLDNHYVYMRYTPGIKQEFIFNSRSEFLIGDTVQHYKTNLSYSDKYGFGYAHNISDDLTIGLSLQYFEQKFSEEYPTFFSDTSANTQLIQMREQQMNKNFWRGDIGLNYAVFDNLNISLASNNLFIMKDFDKEDEKSEFEIRKTTFNIKQEKSVTAALRYFLNDWGLIGGYESSNSFLIGANYNYNWENSNLTFGSTILHDENQLPYISAILPSISYSNNLFSVTFSYLKYFSNRNNSKSLNEFVKFGINNLHNNYFSSDNVNLTFNFALSFKNEQQVKFVDVSVTSEIFPTFRENYLDHPIVIAKVVNLTDEVITVKPSSIVDDINHEIVFSPNVKIYPRDTIDVPFFTIVSDKKKEITKTKLSQAKFYLTTSNSDPDDFVQKTILLHGRNSWDGTVNNLRYFVKYEYDFSNKYANNIITGSDLVQNSALEVMANIKVIFNQYVKNMNYIADRRATVDYVQFPSETIELQGGDCDDLCVGLSSLLESVGIQTAFIDYKPLDEIGHVALLVNTKLDPAESDLITINDRKYFIRKNINGIEELWIPIEVTTLTNFDEAWNNGAAKFYLEAVDNYGLQKNLVQVVDVY